MLVEKKELAFALAGAAMPGHLDTIPLGSKTES